MKKHLEIAQLGATVLRQSSRQVNDIKCPDTVNTINDMKTALANTQGVGLAAPQINRLKRIIIVASKPTARYPSAPLMAPTVMINPVFEAISDVKIKDWEGCLSVPGIRALVPRHRQILAHYVDESGNSVEWLMEDFIARVFQHELDHLDGMIYLDRVESSQDIIAESEYLKLFAQH